MSSVRELEAWARDALGLGRDAATAFVARVKSVCHRDDGPTIDANPDALHRLIKSIQSAKG